MTIKKEPGLSSSPCGTPIVVLGKGRSSPDLLHASEGKLIAQRNIF